MTGHSARVKCPVGFLAFVVYPFRMDDIKARRVAREVSRQAELDAKIMARADHLVTKPAARQPLPPDSPGNRWAYDYLGRPVNLWGLLRY